MMKIILSSSLFIILLTLFSCTKNTSGYTKMQLNRKADSILLSRIPFIKQEAQEDLKNRLPIELKFKVDSLRNVRYDIPPPPVLQDVEDGKVPAAVDSAH